MNDGDHQLLEAELRKLAPAKPPTELMQKLFAARPFDPVGDSQPSTLIYQPAWRLLLRWLAPAAAFGGAALAFVCWRWMGPEAQPPDKSVTHPLAAAAEPVLKADDVEIDESLVAVFDAVARLPSGQAIRFRCREWTDAVVLRDTARGIELEQRAPRLEVVPVRFETY